METRGPDKAEALESLTTPKHGAKAAAHATMTGRRRWLVGAAAVVLILAGVFAVVRESAEEPDALQPAVTPAAQAAASPEGGANNPLAMPLPPTPIAPAPAPVR